MIDVVYILSKGSIWQDNEILYSLRSVEKHLKNFRKVFVIGYKPNFFNQNVIEIPYKDIFSNKSRNIMAKIHRAASDERISENFILFNDDYFLLQDTDAPTYPYYYNNGIKETMERQFNNYRYYVKETLQVLKSANKTTLHFDLHKPIVYNKEMFKTMVGEYNWDIPRGYIVKSLYCNHFNLPGTLAQDHKINYPYRGEMLPKVNQNQPMFSIADKALTPTMKKYIQNLYPNKSKFEI